MRSVVFGAVFDDLDAVTVELRLVQPRAANGEILIRPVDRFFSELSAYQEPPQPLPPAALTSTSCLQQASTLAGDGPPQQPGLSLVAARGRLQTPVSGRTSSTRSAASLSP